ncbi:hypothetical protein NHJ13734_008889 [Beauveria thailandica]
MKVSIICGLGDGGSTKRNLEPCVGTIEYCQKGHYTAYHESFGSADECVRVLAKQAEETLGAVCGHDSVLCQGILEGEKECLKARNPQFAPAKAAPEPPVAITPESMPETTLVPPLRTTFKATPQITSNSSTAKPSPEPSPPSKSERSSVASASSNVVSKPTPQTTLNPVVEPTEKALKEPVEFEPEPASEPTPAVTSAVTPGSSMSAKSVCNCEC